MAGVDGVQGVGYDQILKTKVTGQPPAGTNPDAYAASVSSQTGVPTSSVKSYLKSIYGDPNPFKNSDKTDKPSGIGDVMDPGKDKKTGLDYSS